MKVCSLSAGPRGGHGPEQTPFPPEPPALPATVGWGLCLACSPGGTSVLRAQHISLSFCPTVPSMAPQGTVPCAEDTSVQVRQQRPLTLPRVDHGALTFISPSQTRGPYRTPCPPAPQQWVRTPPPPLDGAAGRSPCTFWHGDLAEDWGRGPGSSGADRRPLPQASPHTRGAGLRKPAASQRQAWGSVLLHSDRHSPGGATAKRSWRSGFCWPGLPLRAPRAGGWPVAPRRCVPTPGLTALTAKGVMPVGGSRELVWGAAQSRAFCQPHPGLPREGLAGSGRW